VSGVIALAALLPRLESAVALVVSAVLVAMPALVAWTMSETFDTAPLVSVPRLQTTVPLA